MLCPQDCFAGKPESKSKLYLIMRHSVILAAVAINKLLLGSRGRMVCFTGTIQQGETIAKFVVQTLRFITHYWQSTATLWSIAGKGGRDDMSPGLDGFFSIFT